MSRLTQDGAAEPVSRDQIVRRERDRAITNVSVQLTASRTGNLTLLIHTLLKVLTIHTYIHSYIWLVLRCPISLAEVSRCL